MTHLAHLAFLALLAHLERITSPYEARNVPSTQQQVSVSGAAISASTAGVDGADSRIFLVFGAVRVASHSAEFEVHDMLVDEFDI